MHLSLSLSHTHTRAHTHTHALTHTHAHAHCSRRQIRERRLRSRLWGQADRRVLLFHVQREQRPKLDTLGEGLVFPGRLKAAPLPRGVGFVRGPLQKPLCRVRCGHQSRSEKQEAEATPPWRLLFFPGRGGSSRRKTGGRGPGQLGSPGGRRGPSRAHQLGGALAQEHRFGGLSGGHRPAGPAARGATRPAGPPAGPEAAASSDGCICGLGHTRDLVGQPHARQAEEGGHEAEDRGGHQLALAVALGGGHDGGDEEEQGAD